MLLKHCNVAWKMMFHHHGFLQVRCDWFVFACLRLLNALFHPSLPFHPSVLEPNFYLIFSQLEIVRNFQSSRSCEVLIKVEFFFKFHQLFLGEGESTFVVIRVFFCIACWFTCFGWFWAHITCKKIWKERRNETKIFFQKTNLSDIIPWRNSLRQ